MQEEANLSAAFHAPEKVIGIKVKSIKKVENEDVYCLEVPDNENFIANGIVVHNCMDALRYACFSHYFNRPSTRIKPEELNKWYDETRGLEPNLPRFFQDPLDRQY